MNSHNSDHASSSSSLPAPLPKLPRFNLQQAITKLQSECSSFLHHHHQQFFNHNRNSVKTHLESSLLNLENQAKHAICSLSFPKSPVWARIAPDKNFAASSGGGAGMSTEDIEERLGNVPVYALSNASEEFFLISGGNSDKSMALLCFNEKDAHTLLAKMKSLDPRMPPGSQVVPVSLSKVFQLKVEGIAFRLLPESSQIQHAIQARRSAGDSDDSFAGVPVFQSKTLVLMSENKRYRPVFFRKEDLERSQAKAALQQRQNNFSFRDRDVQVAVLEDVVKAMKEDSTSTWNDVVFIPPGFEFELPTEPSRSR